jgi:hypothetical protein
MFKKKSLSIATLLIIILLIAILGVSIYIAIVSKEKGSGGNGSQVCSDTCQKNIAALVAQIISKGNGGGNGGQVCDSECTKQIATALISALTPTIKNSACGETCQKGIACNVLNHDGFVWHDTSGKQNSQTLGDTVAATANAATAAAGGDDLAWAFNDAIAPSCADTFPFPPESH